MNKSQIKKTTRLRIKGVSKHFGATQALTDVAISVAAGEVLALVGENGAGKSTLMKIISGALQPDTGMLELDGQPFAPRNPHDSRETGIAMIYQELSLAPHLTVEENIALGMEPVRNGMVKRKTVRARATEALKKLGHLEINPGQKVSGLNVAHQQIVEIARAIALGCKVLILDEPTSSLSQEDIVGLFQLIRNLRMQGLAIIYISHFLEEVKKISDRFTVLRDGKVVGEGTTEEVKIHEIVHLMIGRELRELYPDHQRSSGNIILELTNLSGFTRPRSASLTVHRGKVVGIAGLVGAGRTELLRAIFGLDKIKDGSITLGTYVGPFSPAQSLEAGSGLLSEDRAQEGLALNLNIAENMTMAKQDNLGPVGIIIPARQLAAAQKWVNELDIRCRSPKQKVSDLSGGNQQKIALTRLLHQDVDLLLLDEPTRGIDLASKSQIYTLINNVVSPPAESKLHPKAVLMVSSYLPELLGICDRIAVMCRGVLGEAKPASAWDEHSLMLAATGG